MCGCSITLTSNKNNMCDAVKEYLANADFE
jgi:hypothetical protein